MKLIDLFYQIADEITSRPESAQEEVVIFENEDGTTGITVESKVEKGE